MLKSSKVSKSRSEAGQSPPRRGGTRALPAAVLMFFAALFLGLISLFAARRGESVLAFVFAAAALLLLLLPAVKLARRALQWMDLSRWHLPFSFALTKTGNLFVLAVFLTALAAVNTGNNLLYLVLAILLSATLAAGVMARLSLHSVFVSLQVPQNVFVRENVSIKVTLKNRKRFIPSFSILIEDFALIRARRRAGLMPKLTFWKSGTPSPAEGPVPVLQHAAYFPAVPAGESRSELISQSFSRRGKYHLEGLRLSTRFPFGFFRRGESISVRGEVLVYPSIREISSDLHLLPFLPGKLEGKHVGQGESLHRIRNYQEGESARLIHWKATAKTGRLMAREYARDEESEFCLILDTKIYSTHPEFAADFEKAVSLAASLAAHFIREGAEFEYLTPGEYIPRGAGIDHLYRVLRSLAVVECDPGSGTRASESGRMADGAPVRHIADAAADLNLGFSGVPERDQLTRILSTKVFKIILTSRPRGTLPAPIWRSSYVVYFDEL